MLALEAEMSRAAGARSDPNCSRPIIVIVDVDCGIDPAEIAKVAAALTRQMLEHVAQHWGMAARAREHCRSIAR